MARRPPTAGLLVAAAAALFRVVTPQLLLRKCCPPDQQMQPSLEACEPYAEAPPAADAASENVSALLERFPSGFPWWLDPNLTVLDDGGGGGGGDDSARRPLLAGQPGAAEVRYGAHPVCDRFDRFFAPTHHRQRVALRRDGRLRLALDAWGGAGAAAVELPPEQYCVDRVGASPSPQRPHVFVVMACPCAHAMCVRKCCAKSQVYEATNWRKSVEMACKQRARADVPWTPNAFEGAGKGEGAAYMLLSHTGLRCLPSEGPALLNARPPSADEPARAFHLLRNGSALADGYRHAGPLLRFCAERVRYADGDADGAPENLYFCAPRAASDPSAGVAAADAQRAFYGGLFSLGAACLLLTLLVYAALPEMRRSAHAKALFCHVAALLAGTLAQAAAHMRAALPEQQCYAVAFIVQFTFLAAFFWLNAMCIDIAWAFSGLRAMQGSLTECDRRKFLYYSLYAWGSPALITAVTAVLEFAEGLPDYLLRPNFGTVSCWFYSKTATLAYFYGPMAALLAANAALFVFTTVRIVRVQRETAMLSAGDSGRHDGGALRGDRKRLVLYLKLFLLMGVTWVTEIVSWAEGSDNVYWYATDAINLLRGLFIFVLFCCKPKVLKLMRRRLQELCPWCGARGAGGSAVSAATRSSVLWSLVTGSRKGSAGAVSSSAATVTSLHLGALAGGRRTAASAAADAAPDAAADAPAPRASAEVPAPRGPAPFTARSDPSGHGLKLEKGEQPRVV